VACPTDVPCFSELLDYCKQIREVPLRISLNDPTNVTFPKFIGAFLWIRMREWAYGGLSPLACLAPALRIFPLGW